MKTGVEALMRMSVYKALAVFTKSWKVGFSHVSSHRKGKFIPC